MLASRPTKFFSECQISDTYNFGPEGEKFPYRTLVEFEAVDSEGNFVPLDSIKGSRLHVNGVVVNDEGEEPFPAELFGEEW